MIIYLFLCLILSDVDEDSDDIFRELDLPMDITPRNMNGNGMIIIEIIFSAKASKEKENSPIKTATNQKLYNYAHDERSKISNQNNKFDSAIAKPLSFMDSKDSLRAQKNVNFSKFIC
jgi:hypothetical protein